MTETTKTNIASTTKEDPIDNDDETEEVEEIHDVDEETPDVETPVPDHHLNDLDDQDDSAIYSDNHVGYQSDNHVGYQSSHADDAEFFDNEGFQDNDTDLEDRSAASDPEYSFVASKSGSIVTTATQMSSVLGDALAPLPELENEGRGSISAQFSLRRSEIDGSFRSSELQMASMYNTLVAHAKDEAEERKSQLCFGSCCDLIKGSMIANGLQLFCVVLSMAVAFPNENIMGYFSNLTTSVALAFAIAGVYMVFNGLAIYGTLRFYKWPVLAAGLWNLVALVAYGVYRQFGLVLSAAFFAYPNIHLFLALHSGKITRENYITTEQYCCCQKKRGDDDSVV